jgi:probable phosphoglycerate mutase
MLQLIFVRHAETQANVANRWQGQRHAGILTSRGQQQIERVAQRLLAEREDIVALYTSPLGRARQTAQSIGAATGLELRVQEGLQEMDFGELDSWTMAEIAELRPDFFAAWQDRENVELAWPGGESRRGFWQRVTGSYDRILEQHAVGTIVIVGHGGSLRVGISYLLDWPRTIFDTYQVDNCSLTRLVYELDHWRLLTLNDTCHLEGIQ